ncbi:hypothetical protein ACQY0O_005061 [Thecaphora frezii]
MKFLSLCALSLPLLVAVGQCAADNKGAYELYTLDVGDTQFSLAERWSYGIAESDILDNTATFSFCMFDAAWRLTDKKLKDSNIACGGEKPGCSWVHSKKCTSKQPCIFPDNKVDGQNGQGCLKSATLSNELRKQIESFIQSDAFKKNHGIAVILADDDEQMKDKKKEKYIPFEGLDAGPPPF